MQASNGTNKWYLLIIVGLLLVIAYLIGKNQSRDKNTPPPVAADYTQPRKDNPNDGAVNINNEDISKLTSESIVVPYVKKNHRLPDYYITKSDARRQGWNAGKGNLCDVLPGRAIGGDVFINREGQLPEPTGSKWYEADLNYDCGRRNADRLVFSDDGTVYVTHDHYKTFEKQ